MSNPTIEKEILLFSGGLDSVIAWFYLNKPKCMYVNLGHRYMNNEIESIKNLQSKFNLFPDVVFDDHLSLKDYEQPDAYIPLRNLFLAMLGTFKANKVWVIVQRGEMDLADRSAEFFRETSKLLSQVLGRKIVICTPFETMTKQDMVNWFLHTVNIDLPLETRIQILKTSRSCYENLEGECGQCSACFRKWISLEANGIDAKYWFLKDPNKWSGVRTYIRKMMKGEYDPERTQQTISVLRKEGWEI